MAPRFHQTKRVGVSKLCGDVALRLTYLNKVQQELFLRISARQCVRVRVCARVRVRVRACAHT